MSFKCLPPITQGRSWLGHRCHRPTPQCHHRGLRHHLLSVAAVSSPLHPLNPTSEFQTAPIRRKRRSHERRMVLKTFRYKVWARSCALPERTPYVLSKRNETVRSSSIRAMYLTMFSSLLYAYTPTGCLPPSAPSRAQTRRRPR
jgi:hypothetical protein